MKKDDKLLSMLGLCRKAGKLIIGFDAVIEANNKGRVCLIVVAADVSERSYRNAKRSADNLGTPFYQMEAVMDDVASRLGKRVGIIGVADENFYNGIKKLLVGMELEEGNHIVD